jgi:ribonuclease HI
MYGLGLLKTKNIPVTIYADSAYVVNCFLEQWFINWRSNGWKNSKNKPVENKDLWEQLLHIYESFKDGTITWGKVKGHTDVKYNCIADMLCTEAMEKVRELGNSFDLIERKEDKKINFTLEFTKTGKVKSNEWV